jgi:hypothetical protein
MKKKVQYKARRTVSTYGHLRSASWLSMEAAKRAEQARFYNCMIAMMFCAFTLEAFLNHVGAEKIAFWPQLKRPLSPRAKLDVLVTELRMKVDIGGRPFQTFKAIFRFRDALVHAETVEVEYEGETEVEGDELPEPPLADWQKLVNIPTTQRYMDDTKAMIKAINSAAGLPEDTLFSPEQTSVEARPRS